MLDEYTSTSQTIATDQDHLLRSDIYDLENRLDSIEERMALLPTNADVMRITLMALLANAVLILLGI
jgi:hypothetical protein